MICFRRGKPRETWGHKATGSEEFRIAGLTKKQNHFQPVDADVGCFFFSCEHSCYLYSGS